MTPAPKTRREQEFEAFKKAWEEYPSQDNEGFVPDRGGFKCGWFAALRWADSTPAPSDVGDEEAANKYWREHRDFHDSDGVDVCQVFKDGAAHARRTQNAEVERLKNDVKRYSEMSLQYMSQIQELRALLEKFDAFTEHCLNREDFAPGGSQEGWAKQLRSDYERMKDDNA